MFNAFASSRGVACRTDGVDFDIEGMGSLNGDVSMVELYYRLGVRQMLIAYNLNNDAGRRLSRSDQGLTDFGRAGAR